MPTSRLGRKGLLGEVAQLVIVAILILVAGAAILNLVFGFLFEENPGDVSTYRSFDQLNIEVEQLLSKEGVYVYEENVPFYIGKDFVLLSFHSGLESFPIYFDQVGNNNWEVHIEGRDGSDMDETIERPEQCEGTCLCLLKVNDCGDTFSVGVPGTKGGTLSQGGGCSLENRFDFANIKCKSYPADVFFYSTTDYFSIKNAAANDLSSSGGAYPGRYRNKGFSPTVHNYADSFDSLSFGGIEKSWLHPANLGNFNFVNPNQEIFSIDSAYAPVFFSGIVPHMGDNKNYKDSISIIGTRNMFFDKLDLSEVPGSSSNLKYVLLTPTQFNYNVYKTINKDDASFQQQVTNLPSPNTLVDYRLKWTTYLIALDANEISQQILSADSYYGTIYPFLKYYYQRSNQWFGGIESLDLSFRELGQEALAKVAKELSNRIAYCNEGDKDSSCFETFIDSCEDRLENDCQIIMIDKNLFISSLSPTDVIPAITLRRISSLLYPKDRVELAMRQAVSRLPTYPSHRDYYDTYSAITSSLQREEDYYVDQSYNLDTLQRDFSQYSYLFEAFTFANHKTLSSWELLPSFERAGKTFTPLLISGSKPYVIFISNESADSFFNVDSSSIYYATIPEETEDITSSIESFPMTSYAEVLFSNDVKMIYLFQEILSYLSHFEIILIESDTIFKATLLAELPSPPQDSPNNEETIPQ